MIREELTEEDCGLNSSCFIFRFSPFLQRFRLSNKRTAYSHPFSTLLSVLSLQSRLLYDHGQLVDIHQKVLLELVFRISLQYDNLWRAMLRGQTYNLVYKILHKNHNIFPVKIVTQSVMETLLCSRIPNTQSKDVQVMIGI